MYLDSDISFTDDIKEVTYANGSLMKGLNEYTYRAYHLPTNTKYDRTIYVLGGIEEIGYLLNEWNKVNPDIWQYGLIN